MEYGVWSKRGFFTPTSYCLLHTPSSSKQLTAGKLVWQMIKEPTERTLEALAALAKAVGGDGSFHFTPVYVCDNPDCKDKEAEAFPYHVEDKDGRLWKDLCNNCFDALECSYPDDIEEWDDFIYDDEGIY